MNYLTSDCIFYVFATMALVTAMLVVIRANPVASAVSLALCFASAAGIMFQMDAQFLGIIQILVYTGAIMVLILFVVMLLNLKEEARNFVRPLPVIAALVIAAAFMAQLCGVVYSIQENPDAEPARNGESKACPFSDLAIGPRHETPSSVIPAIPQPAAGEIIETDMSAIARQLPNLQDRNTVDTVIDERIEQAVINNDATLPRNAQRLLPSVPSVYFSDAYPEPGQQPTGLLPAINLSGLVYPDNSSIGRSVSEGDFPDAALLGYRLFARYNTEIIILSFILLVAAIGSVVLTRRPKNN